MKRLIVGVLALSLLVSASVAVGAAILALSSSPADAAGGCRCPLIYAPVICERGKVYSNQCLADCHHAKACVPYGSL